MKTFSPRIINLILILHTHPGLKDNINALINKMFTCNLTGGKKSNYCPI